jgi:hypothetical protein
MATKITYYNPTWVVNGTTYLCPLEDWMETLPADQKAEFDDLYKQAATRLWLDFTTGRIHIEDSAERGTRADGSNDVVSRSFTVPEGYLFGVGMILQKYLDQFESDPKLTFPAGKLRIDETVPD